MRIVSYQPRLIYPDVPQLQLQDYVDAIIRFMELFRRDFSGEYAFYQFGQVQTPGISDIDLLIIVEDEKWKSAINTAKAIIDSSGLFHFLFIHEPLTICQSLVPHLFLLHTMENCTFLQGSWNPIGQFDEQLQISEDARLFRHAIWNSNIRVGGSALDNTEIGLRRSLGLMNNLLSSALQGNKFLPNLVPITLTSEGIRAEVMSAPFSKQEQLIKQYIHQIINLLNTIDSCIDQIMIHDIGYYPGQFSIFPVTRQRFIVTPLSVMISKSTTQPPLSKLLEHVKIIPTPIYPLIMTALFAQECSAYFPELHIFRRFIQTPIPSKTGFMQYLKSAKTAGEIFAKYQINYFFPRPFSVKNIPVSIPDHVKQVLINQLVKNSISPGRQANQ